MKCDLRDDKNEQDKIAKEGSTFVTKDEGDKLGQKIGAIKYVECSARQNIGVQEVFTTCIEFYFANQKKKGCLIL
jgi:GTPase SAR1 family protein